MFKQINPDMLEGAIRNPIQQAEVVGRALRESVCSTDPNTIVRMGFLWVAIVFFFQLSLKVIFLLRNLKSNTDQIINSTPHVLKSPSIP